MTANYLTRRELAAALQTSPRTLRRLERLGVGPQPTRLGPRLARYPRSAIADFATLREGGAHA